MDNLTIQDIDGGLCVEQLNEYLAKVVEDIADFTKEPTKKRTVNLEIAFVPNKSRRDAQVTYAVTMKSAGHIIRDSQTIYLGKDADGKPVAKPWVLNQQTLPGTEEVLSANAGVN